MASTIDTTEFAVLARGVGVELSDEEIATLQEGYDLLARLVADLGPPAEAELEPALIFLPETR